MVVLGQEPTMYECRVLYIGSAPPVETLKGLDAVQEPLRQRYPQNLEEVSGVDATLCVLPTALEMRYVSSGEVVQFPLEKLSICAGVRAVNVIDGSTGQQVRKFVPVNNIQQESSHPAIFAAIIRRTKGRQIAECHMFICNSTRDALHLVNASATANMAFRKQHGQRVETSTHGNDVIVVKSGIANGYSDGEHGSTVNYEPQSYRQPDIETVRIDTNESNLESRHYQIQQSRESVPEPETIYITFDKSNLKPKGDGNMEVTHNVRQTRRSEEHIRPTYIEAPVPAPVPVFRPMYMNGPPPRPNYAIRHIAPPPPQPVMMQRPVLIRSPPPPQPMMVRQPQRMYTKRVIAPPPPPPRFISQPPMVVRSRARSASPIGRYNSEIRAPKKGTYQPKWEGIGRPKSDIAATRMSRRDMYDYPPPPPPNIEFFQQAGSPREMHLNERAFSRRMHADNRISREHHGYNYPTAYDLHSAMLYDRPTTKSNPRYSSSSSGSSDEGGRNNRLRSSRR
ncbi:uncharacterized protein LOC132749094 [Ruditapes philippinarum]|uniref:uncharacterized protein LOC132749094 n=1 Tax=Ruditapes philippinarum TaxID=129788 RepID=UPI00295A60F3|nr:uncharacterized protein LOC132749094 [Ruditapes philippinarum]